MTTDAGSNPHTLRYTVELTSELAHFYGTVAKQVGIPLEQVLADALYRLAGELSLRAIHEKTTDAT